MPEVPLSITQQAKAGPAGTASTTFQPSVIGQTWHVELVTVTGLNLTVTVARNDTQVIDSTSNDPRPTVTSDSKYDLGQGERLKVSWAGATNGQTLTATITGTLTFPE